MIATVLALLLVGSAHARDADWGPWADRWAPFEGVEATRPPAPPRTGAFETLYRFYRSQMSPRDGARCPYYPTCSGYSITAIRTHGPVIGGLLTLDRLLREYPGMERHDHYPLVTPHETPRLFDPVPARARDVREGRGDGSAR